MELQEIKSRLNILEVAHHLSIEINTKTHRALCPFHPDKTPSLQFSKEKQICTCFSSNCTAGTMDVIGLVEKKLNLSTHEALKYLTRLAGETSPQPPRENGSIKEKTDYHQDFEQMQSSFMASKTARAYAKDRCLDAGKLSIGYNAFKGGKFSYLRGCITFGLRDGKGKVVSMYGRSVRDNDKARHYYTSNRQGLYPRYPSGEKKKLIMTESIIDAATLLSIGEITSEHEVLALYGTNGLTTEHIHAIQRLEGSREIILFFDGDQAGKAAIEKQGEYLQKLFPEIKISAVDTPEGEDINSLAQGHELIVFTQLLKDRILFTSLKKEEVQRVVAEIPGFTVPSFAGLQTENPNKIAYTTETAAYYIKGGIRKDLDSLKVTLVVEHPDSKAKSRNKLDLYEDKQTEKVSREAAEKLGLRADLVEHDLNRLTDLLDEYRESTYAEASADKETKQVAISASEKEKCISFLRAPNLLSAINELIGKSGVAGEENNRLFLFGIASSYKMEETLHALIQGSSGSGKTHLLATIMDFMPPEDTLRLTRVTESSFYNYGRYELQNKLIGMEDYDGLEEKAELAFRELQSKGMISSSTSGKNEHTGEISGYVKTVYGPIASLSATTKGEIYEDNMSRCFLVAVDESQEQTQRIIRYQNEKAAGLINKHKEKETRDFLRNCMRLLKPCEVVNPYANKIELPKEAHKIRRLNDLFQSYVKQVTLLSQYQRKKDSQGRLITDKEDVKTAIGIMFESIVLKVDELDGSLRDFYERLKSYVLTKSKDYEFTRREIRQETNTGNTQLHRYMKQLTDLEYVYQSGGHDNRGHKYKIQYWDNNQVMRDKISRSLNSQLEQL